MDLIIKSWHFKTKIVGKFVSHFTQFLEIIFSVVGPSLKVWEGLEKDTYTTHSLKRWGSGKSKNDYEKMTTQIIISQFNYYFHAFDTFSFQIFI